jgi:hypothetical protein
MGGFNESTEKNSMIFFSFSKIKRDFLGIKI